MLLPIPNVLSAQQVAQACSLLENADWVDSKVPGNTQIPESHPAAAAVGGMILGALGRNALFLSAALPSQVFPPLFQRDSGGQTSEARVDPAIRQVPDTDFRIRTDLSATLFLTAPEDYDGGELVVQDTCGAREAKLPAGHAILYPASFLHHVRPVTRGTRMCSIFWIQSMIRDDGERTLLFELDRAIQEIAPDHPAAAQLTAVYQNLIRRWANLA